MGLRGRHNHMGGTILWQQTIEHSEAMIFSFGDR
jgi:hypothetical protein